MFPSSYPLRCLFCLAAVTSLGAQTKPGTDVLTFVDGEKLIGEFQSATDAKVVFRSDMGFVVTVDWTKVKELHSANKFAAIPKDLTLRNSSDTAKVPQGTVEMTDQNLAVSAGPQSASQTIAVNKVSTVVDQATFDRSLKKQSFFQGWAGAASLAVGVTQATVSNQTLNTSVDISKADHNESWMRTRNRTTFSFNSTYGKVTQDGAPDSKVSLFHSDLLRDHYLTDKWFVFVGASFDHNFGQGLNLLQAYGGGVGAVVYKSAHSEFDARAGIGFLQQRYTDSTLNKNLIGSRFGQNYTHTFAKGITFYEQGGVRPAWTNRKTLFAGYVASLTVPVYRRMGLSISSFDYYVNDPPPYFKKNVFQLMVGATYTIK